MTVTAPPPPPELSAAHGRLMRRATYASVAVASVLIVVKLGAWAVTDSVALLSTLVDSLLDAAASVVNLIAVRQSLQPADHEHRFGHGKAEPLAGLGQAAFIAGSSALLVIEATSRLFAPVPVARTEVGIGVMIFAIVVTIGLVAYQRFVIGKTKSVAISADSLHYAGDVLINASVIVSLIAAGYFGLTLLDPIFAIGIAAYLLYNAYRILKESLNLLMDREFDEADRERIAEIALSVKGARNIHDLRTRSAGPMSFIQLHVEMGRDLPLWRAHDIADAVEIKIREAFPNAEVLVHQDPEGIFEHHPEFVYEDGEPREPPKPGSDPADFDH